MSSLIAIIPARGGSKGVPEKNIYLLAGRPLISYTVEAALAADIFTKIIVSSDSDRILNKVQSQLNVLTQIRPKEFSLDDTPSDSVVQYVLESNDYDEGSDVDIVLLQPTSPFRSSRSIIESYNLFKSRNSIESVIGVKEVDNKYLKSYVSEEGALLPVYKQSAAYCRRQDLPKLYMPNGAIYWFTAMTFFQGDSQIPRDNLIPFEMSDEESIDIDTLKDFELAENILLVK